VTHNTYTILHKLRELTTEILSKKIKMEKKLVRRIMISMTEKWEGGKVRDILLLVKITIKKG
jgi:hypothetical protein